MTASLRALMAGLIDYAGLFPPAKLPLDASLANYVRYRRGPDRWMLGRFICPAARLAEAGPLLKSLETDGPLPFAALGRGGNTAAEFLANLRTDVNEIAAFRKE